MKWYIFRKRVLPIVTPILYYFKLYDKENVGVDFFHIIVVEGKWFQQLMYKEDFEETGKFLFEQLRRDKDFVKKRMNKSREIGDKLLKFCRTELKGGLKGKSNEELLLLLGRYHEFYGEFGLVNMPPWLFMADFLAEKIKESANIPEEDLVVLSTSNALSYTKKEELAVISLAIKIKKDKIKHFEKIFEFKEVVDGYFWIPFDYFGPEIWDKEYYIKKIKKLVNSKIEVLKSKKSEIVEYQKGLIEKQGRLSKKLNLNKEVSHWFEVLKDAAVLQDKKKAITTESHYYLQNLLKEIARRMKFNHMGMYFLTNEEIEGALLSSKSMKEIIGERKKLGVGIVKDKKVKILHGKEARDYVRKYKIILPSEEVGKKVNEIKGGVGSRGHAVGRVRIIESPKEMFKFKKGEILVTTMTTPDFIPIIKKAKAIVTDEGGITSHAAIISRELGIPCVIGTKNATKVLNDGDKIEVRANRGIVRRIR